MTSAIRIDSVKPAPSGKSLIVKSGEKSYFAKLDSGIDQGMTIEAETKASEYNGKTNIWIEKWRRIGNGAAAAPAQQTASPEAPASGINMAFMPFVSNVVAHAIQAGHVQAPGDIQKWAQSAYSTALSLEKVPF